MTGANTQLTQIRQLIEGLNEDDRIRVQAIATTLRNIIKSGPQAQIAFALVGAEFAEQ